MRRDDLEALDVLEFGVDAACSGWQREGDVVHPDPIKPALQHRGLTPEPSRIHKHDSLAPLQSLKVVLVRWPVCGITEMVESLLERECWTEVLVVEVENSDVVTSSL